MSQIALCFFADGPRWDNIIRIAAYPVGYSYTRPFRYRDERIQPALLRTLSDPAQRSKLIESPAVVLMRFQAGSHASHALPVRRATIRHIAFMPGNHEIYFTLGEFFGYDLAKDLSSLLIDLPVNAISPIGDAILFQMPQDLPDSAFPSQLDQDATWIRYADLIAQDTSLPINPSARSALYLRVCSPIGKTGPAPTEVVRKSSLTGPLHAVKLTEGHSYEMAFFHRVPALIGTKTSIARSVLTYTAPSSNLQLNRTQEDLTSNYQKHVLMLTAMRPSGTYDELRVSPPDKMIDTTGTVDIHAIGIPVPMRVKFSFWHRLKRQIIWLLLTWGSISGGIAVGHLLDGKTNTTLIGISALLGLGATAGVYLLQNLSERR